MAVAGKGRSRPRGRVYQVVFDFSLASQPTLFYTAAPMNILVSDSSAGASLNERLEREVRRSLPSLHSIRNLKVV